MLLCGCRAETGLYYEILEEYIPKFEEQISINLPNFDSCPDGWNVEELDVGNDYKIPYCEPPNLSELKPDSPLAPSPPNFLPCPSGWNEVDDVRTGLVTCHPYVCSRWTRRLRWR